MRLPLKPIFYVLVLIGTTSCYTMSDLHEARVLEKGESQLGLNTGYAVPAEGTAGLLLDGSMYYRHGVGGRSEFSYRVSWQMTFRTDFKYQFYESANGELAMATGINAELGLVNVEGNLGLARLQTPFYLSYHPTDAIAFYGNIKYNFQVPGFEENDMIHAITYNSGLRLGKKSGIMIEMNHAPEFNSILNAPDRLLGATQLHAGLYLRF